MSQEHDIGLSQSALRRIGKLMQDAQNPELKLRVYIVGGGCSGFQYGFKLDDKVTPEDKIIDKFAPIHLLIDENSLPYLKGAEIDYIESLQGSRFQVNNPNAESTCGCGASFCLKEDQAES